MLYQGKMGYHKIILIGALMLLSNALSMDIVQIENRNTVENGRPVVIVIGERVKNKEVLKRYPYAKGKSYIAASYVKFLESAGARVMPVSDATNTSEVEGLFHMTNGVLFPGGGANLLNSGYQALAERFFELIKEGSKHGDEYPLMGICLGMEQQAVLIARKNILQRTKSENIGLPMNFTEAAKASKFFSAMPDEVMKTLSETVAPFNNHKYSVLPKSFVNVKELRDFFNVLSTSKDKTGKTFIASIEAKDYPIFGFQWHPEKTMFEWKPSLNIDRSEQAIAASQFMANRFVHFAKQNKHEFPLDFEDKLIYRHQPVYTGDIFSFEQIYIL